MEYLSKIIEQAAEKIGNQRDLEIYLDLARGYLTEVKAGRRGLPDIAQDKLEKLMNLEGGALRAASAIITEKKPEKVEYWKKKLIEFEKLAACILVGVILNMTPTPSQAAPMLQVSDLTLYIMSNAQATVCAKSKLISAIWKLPFFSTAQNLFAGVHP